jgi:hypothetical protein
MLVIEIEIGGHVHQLPPIRPGDPPASVSDYRPEGRQLVILSLLPGDEGGEVLVSRRGAHVELGISREIHSAEMVVEHRLSAGQTYERSIQTRHGEALLRVEHRAR